MRALLVYESMFGSTSEVARAVAAGLADEGVEVEVDEVRSAPAGADAEFDLLVVGAPTHAFSLSRPATRKDAVRQGADADVAETGLREWIAALGPREEARQVLRMLRRAMVVAAVVACVVTAFANWPV